MKGKSKGRPSMCKGPGEEGNMSGLRSFKVASLPEAQQAGVPLDAANPRNATQVVSHLFSF